MSDSVSAASWPDNHAEVWSPQYLACSLERESRSRRCGDGCRQCVTRAILPITFAGGCRDAACSARRVPRERRDGGRVNHPRPIARHASAAPARSIHAIAAIDRHAGQHALRRRSRGHAVPHLFAEISGLRIAPPNAHRRTRQNLHDPDPRAWRRAVVLRGLAPPLTREPARPIHRFDRAVARSRHTRRVQQAHQCPFEYVVVYTRWLCHINRPPRIGRPRRTRIADFETESIGTPSRAPSVRG